MRVRFVELPAFCTVVNVPPTITRLPTTVNALTRPLVMFGVKFAGSALTMAPCGGLTALASGTTASREAARSAGTTRASERRADMVEFLFTEGIAAS